jgi:hypothetical protein
LNLLAFFSCIRVNKKSSRHNAEESRSTRPSFFDDSLLVVLFFRARHEPKSISGGLCSSTSTRHKTSTGAELGAAEIGAFRPRLWRWLGKIGKYLGHNKSVAAMPEH